MRPPRSGTWPRRGAAAAADGLSSLHAETSLPEEEALAEPDEDFGPDDATHITQMPSLHNVHVPKRFDEARAGGQDYYSEVVDGYVVAAWRTSRKAVDRVVDREPKLFLQYAAIEGYPLITILLASLDEDQQLERSFGWPLDLTHDDDREVVDALMLEAAVRFVFYDRKGELLRTYDAQAPLELNMRWIKRRAEDQLADEEGARGMFGKATEAFFSEDYERLGTMRHNFHVQRFEQLESASEIKLAAGIVGYWSSGEVFEYLIGNRSFPLADFRAIQKRVVEAALRAGIYLNQSLRQVALEEHFVDQERALTRRLLANFAELNVGLKVNDLDPVEQWENWDALLGLADEVGVQPDPEVIEIAQASLRRAQEFQRALEEGEEPGAPTVVTSIDDVDGAPRPGDDEVSEAEVDGTRTRSRATRATRATRARRRGRRGRRRRGREGDRGR